MNVNEKGLTGVIETIRDLNSKGFECFTPLHDYSSVDLIVLDHNKKAIRLQVKYRAKEEGSNVVGIGFCTVVNGKKVPIDLSHVDGWAIYCPTIDKVVYINKNDIDLTLKGVSFRLVEAKSTINKDKKSIKMYHDFDDITNW